MVYGYQTPLQMAEKGLPGCAASVGCTLFQAAMSHSKGGSENVCVNYDTSTALALASLDVNTSQMHQGLHFDIFFLLCFEVYILTALNVMLLMLSYSTEMLESGLLASVLWMYVSVCWWLHPLSGLA